MRRNIAFLTLVCLLLTFPAAALEESAVTLVCSPEGDGYSLTLEGLTETVCALQLDLTLQGDCPDVSFQPDASNADAYTPECRTEVSGAQTNVTIYMTAQKGVLASGSDLHLGTLRAVGNTALPKEGTLILLDRALETTAGSGTVAVQADNGGGGGSSGSGGSGGGGSSKPSNKPDSTSGSAPDSTPALPFFDVAASAYYTEAVAWAVENGITTGMGSGKFGPDALCTRAQIVTFLYRAVGSPDTDKVSQFTDVPTGSFYDTAVQWAVSQGVTKGTGNAVFSPDLPCTRAQAVTFLYRANGSPHVNDSVHFTDVLKDAYYADAVQWAAANDITMGVGAQRFAPDTPCTRAQIVTFLYRNSLKDTSLS